jgi:adenylate cyclase
MDIDPDYGLATGLAAWCHGQLVVYTESAAPTEERAWALRLAQRAAILDSDDPLVLTARRCSVTAPAPGSVALSPFGTTLE